MMTNKIKAQAVIATIGGLGIILASAMPSEAAIAFLGSSDRDFGIVDTTTGTFTSIGNTDATFFDIATATSTLGYGVTVTGDFYSIDLNDASVELIGNTGTFINGLGFDDSGNLFGIGGNGFYSIDVGTGVATLVTTITGFNSSGDLAFDGSKLFATSSTSISDTSIVFGTDNINNSDTLFSFNTDGTNQNEIGFIGFEDVYGLTYQEGTLFGFTYDRDILDINVTTGAGTDIGDVSGIGGSIFAASPSLSETNPETTPEPNSLVATMVVMGIAALSYRKKD